MTAHETHQDGQGTAPCPDPACRHRWDCHYYAGGSCSECECIGFDAPGGREVVVQVSKGKIVADSPQPHQDANLTPSPAGVASVPTVDAAAVLHSECRACGTYTGAYDVEALQARVALLAGLLREVEWGGIQIDRALDDNRLLLERACPSCGRGQSKGHAPDCRLAAALADGGREDCR